MKEGKLYCETRIEYDDTEDLAKKYRDLADSIDGDRLLVVNKPHWLRRIIFNWGGDGP